MSAIRMRLSLNNLICTSLMSKDAELSFLRVFNTSHTFEKGQLGSSGLLSTGLLVLLAFTALSEEKLAGSPVL